MKAFPLVGAVLCAAASAWGAGVTFDFRAESEKLFPRAAVSGNLAPTNASAWGTGYSYVHTEKVPADSPIRREYRRHVRCTMKDGVGRIEKLPSLLTLCGGDREIAGDISGGYDCVAPLGVSTGCLCRITFDYRHRSECGRASVMACGVRLDGQGRPAPQTGPYSIFDVPGGDSEWFLFTRTLRVPDGFNALKVIVRIDGVGELVFRNFTVTLAPEERQMTVRQGAHGVFSHDFALSENQCGVLDLEWKRAPDGRTYVSDRLRWKIELPPCVRWMDALLADRRSFERKALQNGGELISFAPAFGVQGHVPTEDFNAWGMLGCLLKTVGKVGDEGRFLFWVEYEGVRISNVGETRLFVVPEIRAEVPKRYQNGLTPGGTCTTFADESANRLFADLMAAAGVRWYMPYDPKPQNLALWRAAGIRTLTPEYYFLANGYRVGDPKGRPAEDRYVALDRNAERDMATCPLAVIEERPFFLTNTVPEIARRVKGCDGVWANWEPYMFNRQGCMCARCRADFAKYVGVSDAEMARDWPKELGIGGKWHEKVTKYRSLRHGQLVRTIDRHVRALTGGEKSLGFIPGIAWCEMSSYWRPNNYAAEVQAIDYAGGLKWIDPWGPYPWWNVRAPFALEDAWALPYFLAAKDIRLTVDKDYPAGRRPRLLAFPHGRQCIDCITEPEYVEMALDAFFFNRWEASVVYYFPQGYDARYWRAFADATTRAARFENYVWDGVRADERTTVTATPETECRLKRAYPYLPASVGASALQQATYDLNGNRIVAVMNFREKTDMRFVLKTQGLSGSYRVRANGHDTGRMKNAEELAKGIRLVAPASRTTVFELVATDGK